MQIQKCKIGLDIGTKRIGIAKSDILGFLASPLETYYRKGMNADTNYVAALVTKYDADAVVIGLPLKLSGEEGQSVEMVKKFAEALKSKTDAQIIFQDERLTTVSAERVLLEADMRRERRKEVIDSVASQFILQAYLDKNQKK